MAGLRGYGGRLGGLSAGGQGVAFVIAVAAAAAAVA